VTTNAHPLDVLGDRTRREIFERLRSGPRAVGELADGLPVSRPAVSQHLRVLKEAGLVVDRKVGTRRLYEVAPDGLLDLRDWFDGFWSDALDAYKDVVERKARRT
jgi:DNA-binding transcriptional ArsR family regulator